MSGLLFPRPPVVVAPVRGRSERIYTGTPEGVGPVNTGDLLEGVGTITLTIGPAE